MGTDTAAARRAIRLAKRFDDDRQLSDRAMYLARLVADGKASDRACRESLAELVKDWPDHRFKAWNGNREIAEEARYQLMRAIMSPTVFDWGRCAARIVVWIAAINRRTAHKVLSKRDQRFDRCHLVDVTDPSRAESQRRFVTGDFADRVVARVNEEFDVSQALGATARLDERGRAFCELFDLPAPVRVDHGQSRAARRLIRQHSNAKAALRRFLADELSVSEERTLFAAFAGHRWSVWERVARITLHLDDDYAAAAWAALTYPTPTVAAAS